MSEELTVGQANGSEHAAAATAAETAVDTTELPDRIHALIMAHSGVGKTHLIATFPKPILLLLFDPVGKEQPLLDRGIPTGFKKGPYCYYREVFSKKDTTKLIARVEYWSEPNPAAPTAYDRWIKRSVSLEQDIDAWGIQTTALDTGTYFHMAAHAYGKVVAVGTNNGMAHYGYSNAAVQQTIMMRIPNLLQCNSLVTCHEAEQRDESEQDLGAVIRKMPAFPGQLPNLIPGGFSEVWHQYVDTDGQTRLLQTQRRPTNALDCKSLLHLPDPIVAHYEAIKQALIEMRKS